MASRSLFLPKITDPSAAILTSRLGVEEPGSLAGSSESTEMDESP